MEIMQISLDRAHAENLGKWSEYSGYSPRLWGNMALLALST